MYARSTTMQGNPEAMDQVISYVRDRVMPLVEGMEGYVGISMLCDREAGRCVATTTWDTAEAMRASAEAVAARRTRAAEMMGGSTPEVQEWEVVAMHRVHDTPADGAVRLIWARGEQGQLDRIVDAWRTTIPPQLEAMPGFCAVSVLADRDTMRAVSAVSYESREAMNRSADQALTLRDRFAATMGFDITDVEEYDVVLAHLRIPEMV
jgi:heme-degrading monooxygenase HmoA